MNIKLTDKWRNTQIYLLLKCIFSYSVSSTGKESAWLNVMWTSQRLSFETA